MEVLIYYTEFPIRPGPQENSVIWQNTEKYNEGKFVSDFLFPISSVGIFYLGRAVTALHSLYYQ
jgi:hypothetical protein